jgi:tripartite-type tricarboxylate transporter receptor subunit TctC
MFAPAKTPPSIVSRLNKEVGELLRAETTKKTLVTQGVDAQASTPEGLDEIVRSDIAAFRLVMDTAGLRRN